MSNKLKQFFVFAVLLTIFGTILAFSLSPLNFFILNIFSFISFFGESICLIAIAIFLIMIYSSSALISILQKLSNYQNFNNIDSDIKIARRKNFFSIYFWNCVFGFILISPILFLIYTIFPFEKAGDFDFALITAIIVLPGFLLSLRLLTNPVQNRPQIPLYILLVMPDIELEKIREIKERTASFYFSFVETVVFSAIVLYTYQIMKSGQDSFYSGLFSKITPQYPILMFAIFLFALLFAIFITTAISEFLLERYHPIIQE